MTAGCRKMPYQDEFNRFEIRAKEYDQVTDKINDYKLIYPSSFQIQDFVVNPDQSGKVFCVEMQESDSSLPRKNVLKELDIETGQTVVRLSYKDHPFVNNIIRFAIDTKNEHIYWTQNKNYQTNTSDPKDRFVGRANYISNIYSGQKWIHNDNWNTFSSYPASIVIDQNTKRIYWVDVNLNSVLSAKLIGETQKERDIRFHAKIACPEDQYPNCSDPKTLGLVRQ